MQRIYKTSNNFEILFDVYLMILYMKERLMMNKKLFCFRAMFVCVGWFSIIGHIVLKIATRGNMLVFEAVAR